MEHAVTASNSHAGQEGAASLRVGGSCSFMGTKSRSSSGKNMSKRRGFVAVLMGAHEFSISSGGTEFAYPVSMEPLVAIPKPETTTKPATIHGTPCVRHGPVSEPLSFENMLSRFQQLELKDPTHFQHVTSRIASNRQVGIIPK